MSHCNKYHHNIWKSTYLFVYIIIAKHSNQLIVKEPWNASQLQLKIYILSCTTSGTRYLSLLTLQRHYQNLHRDIQETLWQLNRYYGSSRLHWWSKHHYNKLLPTGNSSPAPRFYGLPKIHVANCPMWPIVSACGKATYHLAKFLTKILQKYTGITHLFVKDSKGFIQYLRSVHIEQDEELVSFDISAFSLVYLSPQPYM